MYAEAIIPFRSIEWVYEPNANLETAGGICPVLRELCEKLEGRDNVKVYMCDVLEPSRNFKNMVNIVNVDPPTMISIFTVIFQSFSDLFLR